MIALPTPLARGALSVEEALRLRRSMRDYADEPLSLSEVAQCLWAAQGITDPRGYRTAPSAGATYPLELYLLAGEVDGLEPGLYRYLPAQHGLVPGRSGDLRDDLASAALGQAWVRRAPACLVFAAAFERTTARYGHRGRQYVHMEAGHAAQNVYLQAAALGLGTVAVGAFEDSQVQALLDLPADQELLYLMPVGILPSGRLTH
ncbi:MAG: SagB/ThcOx family dehydrogenase [Anaerolineae bacterium]|nr:SagB/ThcOx family dehydrogenase [Anaerolineae bacterium]